MPSRRDVFTNTGIYHIFNKTIDHKKIFDTSSNIERFLALLRYYRSSKAKLRYSQFLRLPGKLRKSMQREVEFRKYFKIQILAYSLMPNHFHLLIRQLQSDGIIRSVTDVLNAITRYFNLKKDRVGTLFLTQFKSKVMLSREQLIHTGRYIHLNEYSSGLVDSIEELLKTSNSSLAEYLTPDSNGLCNTDIILAEFNNNREKYKQFVINHADYQKSLEYIKHAEKWL